MSSSLLRCITRSRPIPMIRHLIGSKNVGTYFRLPSFRLSSLFSTSSSCHWKSIKPKNKVNRYKLRTHQGASKRFFVTGNGQFKRSQAGKQHLMTGLSHTKRRKLKPMIIVEKTHATKLRKLLPYVGKRAGFRRVSEQDSVWWKLGRLQKSGFALRDAIRRARLVNQGSDGRTTTIDQKIG